LIFIPYFSNIILSPADYPRAHKQEKGHVAMTYRPTRKIWSELSGQRQISASKPWILLNPKLSMSTLSSCSVTDALVKQRSHPNTLIIPSNEG
jgi:hypothetical protein